MVANPKAWKEQRKVAMQTIDSTYVLELLLKQFNYQRMNGVDLIDDLDKLVNWYLWLCKKHPKPDEVEVEEKQDTGKQPSGQSKDTKKKKSNDKTPPAKAKDTKK